MSSASSLSGLSVDQIDWLMVTANCLLAQKYPERALVLLEFLLCYEPENQHARQMLCYCYHLVGRNQEASDSFNTLDPVFYRANPINGLLNAKVLAALGREEEAVEAFDKFSRAANNDL